MQEVDWKDVQKQNADAQVAAAVSLTVIGKTLKEAVDILEQKKVAYIVDDGSPRQMDVVGNRLTLKVEKDVVQDAQLG